MMNQKTSFFSKPFCKCTFVAVQYSEKHNYKNENSRDLCSLIQDQQVWLNFQHWAPPAPDDNMHKALVNFTHHDLLEDHKMPGFL
jgi:hypothetical protein